MIDMDNKSHPVWVRGLKRMTILGISELFIVAPRVGAWIETGLSLPFVASMIVVAPRVGAWIETWQDKKTHDLRTCRTPCGCVD